jgi:hypothetical protein
MASPSHVHRKRLIGSTSPAKPDEVETGVALHAVARDTGGVLRGVAAARADVGASRAGCAAAPAAAD